MSVYQTSTKTRQALIEATGRLAAEKGFNAISTRAIAKQANENIGSIHYHFGGKEKLFEAVILSVVRRWQEKPLEAVIADCDLTTRSGQAKAIRGVVTREVSLLFDKEAPSWHNRVIFQVMKYPNALQNTFNAMVTDPESERVCRLFQTIDPNLDDETAEIHFLLLLTPLISHAEYQDIILRKLGQSEYSPRYLKRLIDTSTRQTLLFFNLPTSVDETSHESE